MTLILLYKPGFVIEIDRKQITDIKQKKYYKKTRHNLNNSILPDLIDPLINTNLNVLGNIVNKYTLTFYISVNT